jgi:Transmembrane secretion effector
MRVADSLAALRERQFRLLFTGQLISLVGDSFATIALAFAVLDLTGSATDLGIVLAAKTIPLVVFLLVGGVFADRLSRRLVMLTADLARLASQGAVAALVLTHAGTVWEIAALQVVAGTATAFFNPASTGLTPLTIRAELLQQANALRGLSMSVASLCGLAAGGAFVTLIGPGWALAVDSASFGASAFFLARLQLPAQVQLPPQSFLRDLREGWVEFSSRTWVWTIVVAASVGNALTSVFVVLCAYVAKTALGGAAAYTIILGGISVGSLLGGVVALHVRVRRPLFLGSSLLGLVALPIALLALRAPTLVIAAGGMGLGASSMIFNALWETSLQQHVPMAALSRVSAYDWFGSLAFSPLGLIVAGPAAAAFGTNATLWAAAAGSLVVAAAALAPASVRTLESATAAPLSPAS